MSQEIERELGWDDEIEKSGPEFILLPEGSYNFRVEKFERGRHTGSANLPACNKAVLTLKVDGGEHGEATVTNNLFLHSKTEGFLSAFFEAIGQKKEGERVKMNWNMVIGAVGRCELEINRFTSNKGNEIENNQVKTFLPYEEYLKHAGGNQQPTQQAPFPTNTQPPQQQGGFTPGQF
ncbi:hypothetical protein ACS127_17330 [Amphibacillus sp. Q70]|uniref:hypothetical protein n=1 Tax=Amphibacillus sp. Q70 TaxID=3453416 RepID=UPI003F874C13